MMHTFGVPGRTATGTLLPLVACRHCSQSLRMRTHTDTGTRHRGAEPIDDLGVIDSGHRGREAVLAALTSISGLRWYQEILCENDAY